MRLLQAISLSARQKSSSRLTLVLCPAITMERLRIVDVIAQPFQFVRESSMCTLLNNAALPNHRNYYSRFDGLGLFSGVLARAVDQAASRSNPTNASRTHGQCRSIGPMPVIISLSARWPRRTTLTAILGQLVGNGRARGSGYGVPHIGNRPRDS